MGGELGPGPGAPSFLVMSMKDPDEANLDRVQIVKGWLNEDGTTAERVYDVVWAGDRRPGADGKLPAIGSTVDLATGEYTNNIGAVELAAVWRDPDFDPRQSAFYYARVLQIPTPRYSLLDAIALGIDPGETGKPATIQERATPRRSGTRRNGESSAGLQPDPLPGGGCCCPGLAPAVACLNDPRKEMLPTVADVERIAALEDPVIRNLQITQAYFELARSVDALAGRENVNWCGFAIWASKQAGQTIRQRDLVRLFERLLGERVEIAEALHSLRRRLDRLLDRGRLDLPRELSPSASFERAAAAAARGNRLVFGEIGREFARYLEILGGDERYHADRIGEFNAPLRDGPPPDGQAALQQAFLALHRARFEAGEERRAELMLLSNLHIGLHEQTRLQPEIRAALDAPVVETRELRRRLLERFLPPWSRPLTRLRHIYLKLTAPLDRSWGRLTEALRAVARQAVTEVLMNIELPDETLCLGERLERRPEWPLDELTGSDVAELVASLDPDPASARGSGADDWSVLGDRMHFIAEFFRAYQREPRLHAPPFTAEQVAAIERGDLPSGSS